MKINLPTMARLLERNVVEIKFERRREKIGWPPTRRMLCTNSLDILQSNNGINVLGWRPPKGVGLNFNPTIKNLIVAWDIFKRDYRLITMDDCNLAATIPEKQFWSYWNRYLAGWTPDQQINFYNR